MPDEEVRLDSTEMGKNPSSRTGFEPVALKPLLASLLGAFSKRRKAIKYRVSRFEHRIEIDTVRDLGYQLLVIEARLLEERPTRVHLSFWEDGEMWIQVCQPGPSRRGGWNFLDSFHGSFEELESRRIVKLFERTVAASRASCRAEDHTAVLRELWQPVRPSG
ncbi:MAG: hypothetical protein GY719_41580 [bacterium]|nr:hypothetical protein [bacterium]